MSYVIVKTIFDHVPVAQWIEQTRPKGKMGVRFPPGVQSVIASRAKQSHTTTILSRHCEQSEAISYNYNFIVQISTEWIVFRN